ncbi:MAG TPA: DNA-directed RNA polymerase subunit omega [Devosia sp.]
MEHLFSVDCQRHIPNPFVVVHLASRRARQLRRGDRPRVATRCSTAHLMALEEIASGAVVLDELFEPLQLSGPAEDLPEDDTLDENELLARLAGHPRPEAPAYAGKEM